MRVGYQSISWGWELEGDGYPMLKTIADAGYAGVELAQHPDEFGSPEKLYEMLNDPDVNLRLLGLAGGSIAERANFVRRLIELDNIHFANGSAPLEKRVRFDSDHPYVYVDSWDAAQDASHVPAECRVALHPHMFKPVQTASEALALLRDHPELRFLPDTAHLTVAGEDVTEVLEEAFNIQIPQNDAGRGAFHKFGPITAVHLKDWTSEFGRSYQFYSRGFGVRFGEGEVNLDKIVKFLRDAGYDGWVVVEQDVVEEPAGAARANRRWLQALGI